MTKKNSKIGQIAKQPKGKKGAIPAPAIHEEPVAEPVTETAPVETTSETAAPTNDAPAAEAAAETMPAPATEAAAAEGPATESAAPAVPTESASPALEDSSVPASESIAADATAAEPAPAEPTKAKRSKPQGPKKASAIDSAYRVLVEAGAPMNCTEMIEAMASKGYWTSPGGKTPAATLYSAILREIGVRGEKARFTKVERGKFAAAAGV